MSNQPNVAIELTTIRTIRIHVNAPLQSATYTSFTITSESRLLIARKHGRCSASGGFCQCLRRLSHKYQIDHLREAYLRRMQSCFGTDLDTWRAVNGQGSPVMKFCNADAIAAVNIARLTRTDSMLPSALHQCCQLDPEHLVGGIPCLNGTREYLSPHDMTRCIHGRQRLLQRAIIIILDLFDPSQPSLQCGSDQCQLILETLRSGRIEANLPQILIGEAMDYMIHQRWISDLWMHGNLCKSCGDALCEAVRKECGRLWVELPWLLGLESPTDWPDESDSDE
ncbi:hypothetical protein DAEQUDRAFT_758038 [Daedalea quercina L-15889]|uniref:Uncharacterized protein n=1 Tax=Daedalea quercina L-15889 TaxID=1314783 RepID=A0A165P0Q4_9APHY|nr:hypothetical protein DAEQUDRAFT_758038 [Daedalea quercina L-15889]